MVLRHTLTVTPIGDLMLVARDDSVVGIYFSGTDSENMADTGIWVSPADSLLSRTADELHEYFAGTRSVFTIPYELPSGTFSSRVWRELETIPYGATVSYGDIARAVGNPRAARAVGMAVGRNPLSIVVPCHRVIGSDGSITGYAGGTDRKRYLLQLEYKGSYSDVFDEMNTSQRSRTD
ncbi:MAG: methylated-DNA--[protein]-cysteine S-methyltransferase [Actinomycetaceae bacterium]|nr:methylated-DNA--[protein]-cysteine S-methyltransferase [Actinomycetaceae bacterium]